MHPTRVKRRETYSGFSSNVLRQKIFQLMTFIDGQFSGGYDHQDMYDAELGHLATLVDMIDAYNMSNPDNRMEYPKTRDETMRPVDWTPYMMNESHTVRITKRQLRRIIKEAMAPDQLQLPLPSSDPRKMEMIEDMADFLMRGDDAIIGAIEGYDSMSAEELSDFLESVYSTAAESMTFQERYGNQRDDAMRAYVADELGI